MKIDTGCEFRVLGKPRNPQLATRNKYKINERNYPNCRTT